MSTELDGARLLGSAAPFCAKSRQSGIDEGAAIAAVRIRPLTVASYNAVQISAATDLTSIR